MAKTKISEWSTTPASNTDIDGINIAEGCAPSGINDAIRDLMAQVRSWQSGASGDPFNGPMNGTIGATTAYSGAFTTVSATGVITSTLATGTAPLTIASTTKVANLNVDLLDGADWASPAALGSTTPAAVSATTLSASSTVSGTGFSNYLASPPAIGGTTAAAGSFTTVNNSGGVRFNTSGSEYARMQLNSTSLELMAGSTTTAGITLNSSNVATLTNNPVLTAGTANGVTYLNGSKVLTSGSALTFNGSTLATSNANASFTSGSATTAGVITSGAAVTQGVIQFGSGQTTYNIQGGPDYVGNVYNVATGSSHQWAIATSEQMRLTSTGLGIGTSSPSAKFHVLAADATTADLARFQQTNQGNLLIQSQQGGQSIGAANGILFSNATGVMGWRTNASSGNAQMLLDSSGNLGVGTTSPSFPLDVVGNSGSNAINIRGRSADNIGTFRFTSNNGATSYATLQAASTRLEIATVSTLPIIFSPNQTEAARIDSSGNLLVGTTSTSGSVNNSTQVVGGIFSTSGASNISALNGVATTLVTLPNVSAGCWLISATLPGQTAASSYSCVAIVTTQGTTASITTIKTATLAGLSLSGLAVQITQVSGGTQSNCAYTAIRLF